MAPPSLIHDNNHHHHNNEQPPPPATAVSPQSVANFEQHENHDVKRGRNNAVVVDPLALPPAAVASKESFLPNKPKAWGALPASQESKRTQNPIRAVVDPIMASCKNNNQKDENTKPFISLALGDPTTSGNFEPCPIVQQVTNLAPSLGTDTAGYVNALGTPETRQVIAAFHSSWNDKHNNNVPTRPVSSEQVVVASGCSGVLDLVLKSLLDPGTFLLVPNPGFPLYQVIAESIGAHVLPYNLLPDQDWEMDFDHIQSLIDSISGEGGQVRGIIVNNPSNPTGTVYSLQHLKDLVRLCNDNCLPIVADEIYGDLTYDESRPFIPIAHVALSSTSSNNSSVLSSSSPTEATVPVITCSGIGKQFLVPGWRVGWAIFYDNHVKSLAPVEHGAKQLAQIVLGASHVAQAMAAKVLSAALPQEGEEENSESEMLVWQRDLREKLRANAQLVEQSLSQAPALVGHKTLGAMYSMVTFEPNQFDFLAASSETSNTTAGEQFSTLLLQEENVFVLPGSCFGIPNAFRVVFCSPAPTLQEALDRLVAFCQRHQVCN